MNFFTKLFTRARLASGHTQAASQKQMPTPAKSQARSVKGKGTAKIDPVALAYLNLSPRVARHVARAYHRSKAPSEDASLSVA